MKIYEDENWIIEKSGIKQDHAGSYKDQFFVDDKKGKNWCVFDNEVDAKRWLTQHSKRMKR